MSTAPQDVPVALHQALTRLLRPLVKLLVHYHISYPYLIQLLKSVYVEVAEHDVPHPSKTVTDSRITMLTGVHRKDVRRLRDATEEVADVGRHIALGAQVASAWLTTPDYVDSAGEPRALFRLATEGEPSFESLVESASKQDLRARSVLDEWLRLGVITVDEHDKVHLRAEAFIPAEGFDERAYIFGMTQHDHLAAAVHNLLGEEPPRLDRCVYYNHLHSESVNKLNTLIQGEAMTLLKSVDRKAREMQRRDSGKAAATERFTLGIYFNREDAAATDKER